MRVLFQALEYGCKAGLHERAYQEVYRGIIQRPYQQRLTSELKAYETDLELLSHFFMEPWTTPASDLASESVPAITDRVIGNLTTLCRWEEAAELCEDHARQSLSTQDLGRAASLWQRCGTFWLNGGELSKAESAFTAGVDAAEGLKPGTYNDFSPYTLRAKNVSGLATALHHLGDPEGASACFGEAMQAQVDAIMHAASVGGIAGQPVLEKDHAMFLLDRGRAREVIDRIEENGCSGSKELLLGRAHLILEMEKDLPDFSQAEALLSQVGNEQALIPLATLYRHTGRREKAHTCLERYRDWASDHNHTLALIDADLESVSLILDGTQQLDESTLKGAELSLLGARVTIQGRSYRRQIPRLAGLLLALGDAFAELDCFQQAFELTILATAHYRNLAKDDPEWRQALVNALERFEQRCRVLDLKDEAENARQEREPIERLLHP